MLRRDRIFKQVQTLLEISDHLKTEFNTFRGAVQFFQHKTRPELFVFQIREGHIADVGRMLMHVSFLVKTEYALFDGMTLKETRNTPEGGFTGDQQHKNALKHVFLNIKLDPWLQHYIFSKNQGAPSPFTDVVRLPHMLEDFALHLPEKVPPRDAILKLLSAKPG